MEKNLTFASNPDIKCAVMDYVFDYAAQQGKNFGAYNKSVDFATKEAKINELAMSAVQSMSGLHFDTTLANKEDIAKNPNFRWAYMSVIDAMIDMVLPEVVDKTIGSYTDVRNGAMGDSFKFEIESNDLFVVSKAGRNQRTVEFQREDVGQRSIVPFNHEISVAVNWYKVACGKESMAKFVLKAVMSIEAEMTKEVAGAFEAAMLNVYNNGASNLHVAGFADKSVMKLVETVSAYNRAEAIFMGTKVACHDLLPQSAALKMEVDSDYVKVGYLPSIYGTDVMVMPQYADYTSTTYGLALSDEYIYVVSPSAQKIVKLCIEGGTHSNTLDHFDTADLTASTTINKSWGIGVCTNAIAGVIHVQ